MTLERLLLFSLSHEVFAHVGWKTVDTVCDLSNESNQSILRGGPWHALQAWALISRAIVADTRWGCSVEREVFSGCPNLVMDLQTDTVLNVLKRGLHWQDQYGIKVELLYFFDSLDSPLCRFDTWLCWLQWHTFLQLRQLSFPNQLPCFLQCSTLFPQLPLPIHFPFCTDNALHTTPTSESSLLTWSRYSFSYPLFFFYTAASRLWFHTDNGSTLPWK